MTTDHLDFRSRFIQKFNLKADASVGTAGFISKEQRVDEANRDIIVTATTSDIDCEHEVVLPEGADTTHFSKLRNIFCDHDYAFNSCIGKMRTIWPIMGARDTITGKQNQIGWGCRFRVMKLPNNPLCEDILAIAREGGLSVSIGFERVAGGRPTPEETNRYKQNGKVFNSIVRKWNWFELSCTMFPCNLSASQIPNADGVKSRMALLDNLAVKGKISKSTLEAFSYRYNELTNSLKENSTKVRKKIVIAGVSV